MPKYYLLAGDASQFSICFLKLDKNEWKADYPLSYLLYIGLMSTISKVLTIFCLLCLCENRKYSGSFQKKSVGSSFKWVPKYIIRFLTKLKREERPF